MTLDRSTIVDLGKGKFGYRTDGPDYQQPILRTWIWPLVNCRVEGMCGNSLETAIDREANCRNGEVSCYLGNGSYFRATMPELGSTKALSITETPVARPRGRGTTELRWQNYRWEKLTRKGWAAA